MSNPLYPGESPNNPIKGGQVKRQGQDYNTELAKQLLEDIKGYNYTEHGAYHRHKELSELINLLDRMNLITTHNRSSGGLVLRDKVNGGPILLGPETREIVFIDLGFARKCKELYPKIYSPHTSPDSIQILRVIE